MHIVRDVVVLTVVLVLFAGIVAAHIAYNCNNDNIVESTFYSETMATEQKEETTCEVSNEDIILPEEMEEAPVTGCPAPIIEETKTMATTAFIETTEKAFETTKTTTAIKDNEQHYDAYTQNDVDYIASVIYKEAGSDYISDETRKYVAEVVLNRVDHKSYPNTIYGVLTQYRQYGTFYKTGIPILDRSVSGAENAYSIAGSVLEGNRVVPKNVIYQAEFPQGSGVWKYIDGIYFCYE